MSQIVHILFLFQHHMIETIYKKHITLMKVFLMYLFVYLWIIMLTSHEHISFFKWSMLWLNLSFIQFPKSCKVFPGIASKPQQSLGGTGNPNLTRNALYNVTFCLQKLFNQNNAIIKLLQGIVLISYWIIVLFLIKRKYSIYEKKWKTICMLGSMLEERTYASFTCVWGKNQFHLLN